MKGLKSDWKTNDIGHVDEHNRIGRLLSTVINAREYGADSLGARTENGCSITAGSNELHVATPLYGYFRVGQAIQVPGAGVDGADLFATITSIPSANLFVLDKPAVRTSENIICRIDDSPVINSIIQSVANPVIYFSGWFQILQPIVIDKNFVTLRGDNRCASILACGKDETPILYIPEDSINITMVDLCLHHTGKNGYGILSDADKTIIDSSIERCWFSGERGCQDTGNTGIDAFLTTTTIHNCVFELSKVGINIKDGSSKINISDALFYQDNYDIVASETVLNFTNIKNTFTWWDMNNVVKR